jgi:nitrogenase-stabilizing/protective protein
MSVLSDLRRLSAAEEFFAYLDVAYDPRVLNVARLHILRRMGEYLSREGSVEQDDAAARERCRAHLETAYADFVARTPIEERVFKVHKDAVREAAPKTSKQVFIPLSTLKS